MINLIRKFIEKEQLIEPGDKILLAISGGIDSMCMLDIFSQFEYPIGVAHLNHKLRGEESDADEAFVKQKCDHYGITYHLKSVQVKELSEINKTNVSAEGRKQRYTFFNDLCIEFDYSSIATAHHADDDVETFLMRAMDGSGLRGLSAIPVKQSNIIRPLLSTSRKDIETYVDAHQLAFREDSSNTSTKYLRNAIRKHVIPEMQKEVPSSSTGIKKSIDIIKDSYTLLDHFASNEIESRTTRTGDKLHFDLPDKLFPGRKTLIYYTLLPFGFNPTQADNIHELNEPGRLFYSDTHTVLFDRNSLVIYKNKTAPHLQFTISSEGEYSFGSESVFSIYKINDGKLVTDRFTECIDGSSFSFPLTIRKWKYGDSFQPLGMNGKSQSLQDYFTNQKLSRIEKEECLLLCSGESIIWVIGHRLSERVKLKDDSTEFFKISLSNRSESD